MSILVCSDWQLLRVRLVPTWERSDPGAWGEGRSALSEVPGHLPRGMVWSNVIPHSQRPVLPVTTWHAHRQAFVGCVEMTRACGVFTVNRPPGWCHLPSCWFHGICIRVAASGGRVSRSLTLSTFLRGAGGHGHRRTGPGRTPGCRQTEAFSTGQGCPGRVLPGLVLQAQDSARQEAGTGAGRTEA